MLKFLNPFKILESIFSYFNLIIMSMKKNALICLIYLSFVVNLQAQLSINYTAKLGMHLSTVKGMETNHFTSEYGYHAGISMEYLKNSPVGVRFEALYESKAFKNNAITNIYYKDIYYYNDVKQNFIKIPILFTYNFPKLSFDLGPHFDFLIQSRQKENMVEVFKDGSGKVDEFVYYNQHHFSKLSLGFDLGVNYFMPHGITMSARYSQSFTNIGVEYPWKKYSLFQLSLGYTINRKPENIRKGKESLQNESEKGEELKYEFFRSNGINRIYIREEGLGNKITMDYSRLLVNFEVLDVFVFGSTGFVENNYNQVIIKDVVYPVSVKMQFTLRQRTNNNQTNCVVEFAVYQEGSWMVILSNN